VDKTGKPHLDYFEENTVHFEGAGSAETDVRSVRPVRTRVVTKRPARKAAKKAVS
jgi:hypothetical protein